MKTFKVAVILIFLLLITACGADNKDNNPNNEQEHKERDTDSKSDSKEEVIFLDLVSVYPEDFDLSPNVQNYFDTRIEGGFVDTDVSEMEIIGEITPPPSTNSDLFFFNNRFISLGGFYWEITDSGIVGPIEFEMPDQIFPEDVSDPIIDLTDIEVQRSTFFWGLMDIENMKIYPANSESKDTLLEIDLSGILEGRITYRTIPLISEVNVRHGCRLSRNDIWCFESESLGDIEKEYGTELIQELKLVRVNRISGEVTEFKITDSTFIKDFGNKFAFFGSSYSWLTDKNLAFFYADEENFRFFVFDLSSLVQAGSGDSGPTLIEPVFRLVSEDIFPALRESGYYGEFFPICDPYSHMYSPDFFTDETDNIWLENETFIQITYPSTKLDSLDITKIYKYRKVNLDSLEILGLRKDHDLVNEMIEFYKSDPYFDGKVRVIEKHLDFSKIDRCGYHIIYPNDNLLLVGWQPIFVIRYGE